MGWWWQPEGRTSSVQTAKKDLFLMSTELEEWNGTLRPFESEISQRQTVSLSAAEDSPRISTIVSTNWHLTYTCL